MNESVKSNRPHAAMLIAAASVSAFALAGIGVLTGIIPSPLGAGTPPATTHAAALPAAAPVAPVAAVPAPPAAASAAEKPAAKTIRPVRREARRADSPPAARPATAAAPQAVAVCRDCGVVESVREFAQEGEASGLGAVAGGVLGAVLGHQVGGGRGKDAATVLGGIGGAVAGHQIERSQRQKLGYEIVVRFEDGTRRVWTQDTPPSWRQGDRVKVVDGVIAAAG